MWYWGDRRKGRSTSRCEDALQGLVEVPAMLAVATVTGTSPVRTGQLHTLDNFILS